MTPGVYTREQVPREHYDKLAEMNVSRLQWIEKSPAHLNYVLTNGMDEDTDSMQRGRAIHLATFEPEIFRSRCVVWENRRQGKDYDAFCSKHRDKEILTIGMHEAAIAVSQAVRNNEHAAKFLRGGRGELTLVWDHPSEVIGKIPCKGRLDFVTDTTIVDLKSTADASPKRFPTTAKNLHYFTKAAWYSDALERLEKQRAYVIVAVEPKPPYVVQVYTVGAAELAHGREQYLAWLDRYAFCKSTNNWEAYAPGPIPLELPVWAQQIEEEGDPTGAGLEI